jgi:hypothetical protein
MGYALAYLVIILAVLYISASFEVAFWVVEKTEHTGFDFVYYLLTLAVLLPAPFIMVSATWDIYHGQ